MRAHCTQAMLDDAARRSEHCKAHYSTSISGSQQPVWESVGIHGEEEGWNSSWGGGWCGSEQCKVQ